MANVISTVFSLDSIKRAMERCMVDDVCEHIEAGEAPYAMGCEDDSFGPVGRFVMCKACHEAEQKAEDQRMVVCHDCKKEVRQANTIAWKWYDFYAEQGDTPIIVCTSCQSRVKHCERLDQDDRDRRAEEASYDDNDDWTDLNDDCDDGWDD